MGNVFRGIDENVLIKCYNDNFQVIGYVDDFRSFTWNYSWSSVGQWEMIFADTSEHSLNILKSSSYIECHNVPSRVSVAGQQTVCGVITRITTSLRKSGGTVKVQGYELKGLTKRRIIATKIPEQATARAAMFELINTQIVNPTDADRAIFGTVEHATTSDLTTSIPLNKFGNVAEVLENISTETGLSYQATIADITGPTSGKGVSWATIEGFDRTSHQNTNEPLLLTFENDTLDEATYEVDMESQRNVAYVGGKGEGDSRKMKIAYESAAAPKGLERVEIFVDARNEAEAELNNKGIEALTEYGGEQAIKLKPSWALMNKFGGYFNVGDKATFVNLGQDLTLTEARITFENNSVECDFTFGYDRKKIKDAMNVLMRSYKNLLNT